MEVGRGCRWVGEPGQRSPGSEGGGIGCGQSPRLNYALSRAPGNTNSGQSRAFQAEGGQGLPVAKSLRRKETRRAAGFIPTGKATGINPAARQVQTTCQGQQGRCATTGGGGGAGTAVPQHGEAPDVVELPPQQW